MEKVAFFSQCLTSFVHDHAAILDSVTRVNLLWSGGGSILSLDSVTRVSLLWSSRDDVLCFV